MVTRAEWVWGTLRPEHLKRARELADLWMTRVEAMGLPQPRYAGTPVDQRNYDGALGEVAFRVLTGRPVPSAEEMAATWFGPDVDGHSVKAITGPDYCLLFDTDRDVQPTVENLVLMYVGEVPRAAIVGWLTKDAALRVKVWGQWLPRPTWVIRQPALLGWQDD